ncbi:MAG: hypothetical protein V4732_15055 [Pseudomonadota bacterium]
MRNKIFFIGITAVSLLAILWWPSSNTDDPSLSEESNSALPILADAKSTITPKVFHSPATQAKPADTPGIKEQPLKTQPASLDETTIELMHEALIASDDRTPPMNYDTATEVMPTNEEFADPELNEYGTREEIKLENTDFEATNPEMQNITQQLQAMRDAGADEAAIYEAEEKLTQSQQMTQRLRDQQSISKVENDNEALP